MDSNIINTNIIFFQTEEGNVLVPVTSAYENLWLNLNQLADLFERDKSVIAKHLKNIFHVEELERSSVVAFFATTGLDGKTYNVEYFNLDAIISVGYRVNSKRGTQFRKWSNNVLRNHIIDGYTINNTKISSKLVSNLKNTVNILSKTLQNKKLLDETGEEILRIIVDYAKTWDLLLSYDANNLPKETQPSSSLPLTYYDAKKAIKTMQSELKLKSQSTNLFGLERNQALESILGNIEQTFDGKPLYSSLLAKASHLLYFIIKDHPFADGNKRIAAFLLILYLKKNDYNIEQIHNNSLVAITLLIAQSDPVYKDTMIDLITNLLKQ